MSSLLLPPPSHRRLLSWAGCAALLSPYVHAQTSPAFGPLPAASGQAAAEDIPMADYLALLRQIAPAAEDGARTYLAATRLRCGREPSTGELRRAMSEGDGDPTLIGLIRAAQARDAAARARLLAQFSCAPRTTR
jgi:hypothetical protein